MMIAVDIERIVRELLPAAKGTVSIPPAMNHALLRTLPRAEALELEAGHNSPAAAPDHFVTEWQKFQQRTNLAGVPLRWRPPADFMREAEPVVNL